MALPRATYRLQFHRGFTFRDALALVPYLASLGVSHIYASPLTEARPGSTHGYDIVDHNKLNPEIGTEDLPWHAVPTAHVAPVRDRDPQIPHAAPEPVRNH